MELAKGIIIPVEAHPVFSPEVFYGSENTGIYFQTKEELHGRITFENLDSIQVCRGEFFPFPNDWEVGNKFPWVYKVHNSTWLKERFNYESKYYGNSYEFGGNVNEMLTDFKHYLFSFHDQFVQVIARGFWFEQAEESLFKSGLQKEHPFLPLPDTNDEKFVAYSLTCQIRKTTKTQEQLIHDAQFCSQKLFEFALELEGNASVNHTLVLFYRNGNLISSLRGYFGKEVVSFDGIAGMDKVKPYIENYMEEVYNRRKAMGK